MYVICTPLLVDSPRIDLCSSGMCALAHALLLTFVDYWTPLVCGLRGKVKPSRLSFVEELHHLPSYVLGTFTASAGKAIPSVTASTNIFRPIPVSYLPVGV